MKKIILLLSAIIALSLMPAVSFAGKTYNYNDLVERDGIFYEKFSDKPVTGAVEAYHENGKIRR